jgi:hypothetical protein
MRPSILERIEIIKTLASLLNAEGLTLTTQQKNEIKEIIMEHSRSLNAEGIYFLEVRK